MGTGAEQKWESELRDSVKKVDKFVKILLFSVKFSPEPLNYFFLIIQEVGRLY